MGSIIIIRKLPAIFHFRMTAWLNMYACSILVPKWDPQYSFAERIAVYFQLSQFIIWETNVLSNVCSFK